MKKTYFLLLAGMLLIFNKQANAQEWGNILSGGAPTFTSNNVGIGTSAVPGDARLHVYNNWGSNPGCTGGMGILVTSIPGIEIDDNHLTGHVSTTSSVPNHNVFEINEHTYLCSFLSLPTSYTAFFVNAGLGGTFVGVNKSTALYTFDVGGDINADGNLTVGKNGTIGQNLTVDINATVNNNLAVIKNATIGQILTVGQSGSIGTNLNVGQNATINQTLTVGQSGSIGTNLTVGNNATINSDLYVKGGLIDMTNPSDVSVRNIEANTNKQVLSISAGGVTYPGPGIALYGRNSTSYSTTGRGGLIYYSSYGPSSTSSSGYSSGDPNASPNAYGHLFLNDDPDPSITYTASMGIQRNGKVVIGQDLLWNTSLPNRTPDGYLLYVQKGILTEKLKVANHGDVTMWADFVFNKDYKLMPLSCVETFVKANKHLPEIPSAGEVANDGIDVADMDAKLLRKIEELTLYVIDQQKEIKHQQKQIDELMQELKH